MKSKDKDQESEENSSDSSESEEEPKKKKRTAPSVPIKTPRKKRLLKSDSSESEEESKKKKRTAPSVSKKTPQKKSSPENSSDSSESVKEPKKKKRKTSPNQGKSSSEGSSDSSESEKKEKKKKKPKQPFSKITIKPEMLANVGSFKAITAQGKARPRLSKTEHQDLVEKKYQEGRDKKEHITLFRVDEKKGLGPKERKEHTVPGPNWTPPSSVGFVVGGISQGSRVWLATEPKNDKLVMGGKSKDQNPSIYARETSTALHYGWTPREPKPIEQFGKTGRSPVVVLTPPSSPKVVRDKTIASIMDVDSGWKGLGTEMDSADKLRQRLTPASRAHTLVALSTTTTTTTSSVQTVSKMPTAELQKAQNIVKGISMKEVKDKEKDKVNVSPSKTIVNTKEQVKKQQGNQFG